MSDMFRITHFLEKLWTKSHGNASNPAFEKNATEDKSLFQILGRLKSGAESYDAQNQKTASAHFLKLRGRMGNALEHKISHLTLYKNGPSFKIFISILNYYSPTSKNTGFGIIQLHRKMLP